MDTLLPCSKAYLGDMILLRHSCVGHSGSQRLCQIIARLCSLNTLLSVEPLLIDENSNSPVVEGGEIKLWCESHSSNPPVQWQWKEAGEIIPADRITTTPSAGDFHGTQVRSEVVLQAEQRRNGNHVRCIPSLDGDKLKGKIHEFKLNVTCRYFTICYYIMEPLTLLQKVITQIICFISLIKCSI